MVRATGTVAPLSAPLRPAMRLLLRSWARTGWKSSRLFGVVEKWGPRLATHPLASRLPNRCLITCDLQDFVQRQTYFLGAFEPIESYLFTRLIREGMVVIDAGANFGQYTMLAATGVGTTGAVHSFEPVPAVFDHLEAHVRTNHLSNVTLNRAALWDRDATITLGLPNEYVGNSGAWTAATTDETTSRIEVPAVRLDTYAERSGLSRIDLVKMDIQGAEPFALAGGIKLIEKHGPTMLMEVHRPSLVMLGSSPEQLWDELSKLGYRAWRIRSSLRSSGPVRNLDGVEFDNFFFHRDDLPLSVSSGWPRRLPKRWACSGW